MRVWLELFGELDPATGRYILSSGNNSLITSIRTSSGFHDLVRMRADPPPFSSFRWVGFLPASALHSKSRHSSCISSHPTEPSSVPSALTPLETGSDVVSVRFPFPAEAAARALQADPAPSCPLFRYHRLPRPLLHRCRSPDRRYFHPHFRCRPCRKSSTS